MSEPHIRGWCPGALRPMETGDGLVVRVRPRGGRITSVQLAQMARLSGLFGNGLVDFSTRGNVQLRGVSAQSHPGLLDALREADLLDPDVETETGRNILVTPFWRPGDGTAELAATLAERLAGLPGLPGKFGFVLDTGPRRVLEQASADIRIERCRTGGMLVRPEGASEGMIASGEGVADLALALARWFIASGGICGGRGRMRNHLAAGHEPWIAGTERGEPVAAMVMPRQGPEPGPVEAGRLIAFPFGQASADQLAALAGVSAAFRTTPWRMLLAEDPVAVLPPAAHPLLEAGDPLLRVHACTGAPGCNQGVAETRPIARLLASSLPPGVSLHVSGCGKGCAHPEPADVVLTAVDGGFEPAFGKRAGHPSPDLRLTAAEIAARPEAIFMKNDHAA